MEFMISSRRWQKGFEEICWYVYIVKKRLCYWYFQQFPRELFFIVTRGNYFLRTWLCTEAATRVFYKKNGVSRNFTKFTGIHQCQSLFFNKVVGLRPLAKKRLWHRCFPVKSVKFLRTPFYRTPLDDCFLT